MKNHRYLMTGLLLCLAPSCIFAQTVLTESFETDGSGGVRYTFSHVCNDGNEDYFFRTDGSDILSAVMFTGMDGTFFYAGQDTDAMGDPGDTCLADIVNVTLNDANITNCTAIQVQALFAEDQDGTNEDWDPDTRMVLETSLDGAAFVEQICFANATGGFNDEPFLDADCDGLAEGITPLTDTFTNHSAAVAGTGSTLAVRVRLINLTAGDEDGAFDNIIVSGTGCDVPVELQSFSID